MSDLLELLKRHGLDRDGAKPDNAFIDALSRSAWVFIKSWWHADDLDTAREVLQASLARHGLPTALPLDAPPLSPGADEELLRRHQIGFAAACANAELARRRDERRFRVYGAQLQWESDEPAWLLVTPAEHVALLALGGPPGRFEARYDAARGPDEVPRDVPATQDASEFAPDEARRVAEAHVRAGRLAEALPLLPSAVNDGHHGVLAELLWIDVLRRLDRRDEARARWQLTAEQWLAGARKVWDTQWQRLSELYGLLELQDPDLFRGVAAQLPLPPPPPSPPRPAAPVARRTGVFLHAVELQAGWLWLLQSSASVSANDLLVVGGESYPVLEARADAGQVSVRLEGAPPAPVKGTQVEFRPR